MRPSIHPDLLRRFAARSFVGYIMIPFAMVDTGSERDFLKGENARAGVAVRSLVLIAKDNTTLSMELIAKRYAGC